MIKNLTGLTLSAEAEELTSRPAIAARWKAQNPKPPDDKTCAHAVSYTEETIWVGGVFFTLIEDIEKQTKWKTT